MLVVRIFIITEAMESLTLTTKALESPLALIIWRQAADLPRRSSAVAQIESLICLNNVKWAMSLLSESIHFSGLLHRELF